MNNKDQKSRRIVLAKTIADKIYEWALDSKKEWNGAIMRAYNKDFDAILKILEDYQVIIPAPEDALTNPPCGCAPK